MNHLILFYMNHIYMSKKINDKMWKLLLLHNDLNSSYSLLWIDNNISISPRLYPLRFKIITILNLSLTIRIKVLKNLTISDNYILY